MVLQRKIYLQMPFQTDFNRQKNQMVYYIEIMCQCRFLSILTLILQRNYELDLNGHRIEWAFDG